MLVSKQHHRPLSTMYVYGKKHTFNLSAITGAIIRPQAAVEETGSKSVAAFWALVLLLLLSRSQETVEAFWGLGTR